MKTRNEIEEKYKWDLTTLCSSDEDFYAQYELLKPYIEKFENFEGKLNNKETIKEYFSLSREFEEKLFPVYLYADLKGDEILSDNKRNQMRETVHKFYSDFCVATTFVTNEFNDLSDEFLDELIADTDFKDQDRFFMDIKRSKKHILSPQEEKLLAGMDFLGGFRTNMRKLTDADFDFGEVEDSKGNKLPLNHTTRMQYLRSTDRTLRKNSAEKYSKVYADHKNVLANNYINHVKASCYLAKVRNYPSALASSLEDDEIDSKVYDMNIEYVRKNIPMINRYYILKKKELGLDEIYGYDFFVEGANGKEEKIYSFEEAIELIKKALAPLGEEYIRLVDKAVVERWIDVFPNKDKRTGGYCTGLCPQHPYILYNFDGSIHDVLGLAHELGHAMHTLFMTQTQAPEKRDYPLFLAEIASTTNEILFLSYLLRSARSDEEKKEVFNRLFSEVDAAIFAQTRLAEFEQKVHALCEEDVPLTKDVLADIFAKLNEDYSGIVKSSENGQYGWSKIPHLYRDFYVFCYSTGMIAAIAFANNILAEKEDAKEKYLNFLSLGDSVDPMTALALAGCDMRDENTYTSCFEYLSSLLDQWEALVGA